MAISIVCSNCNTPYTVPPHLAGKTVTCKRCNALLDVPAGGVPAGGFGYRAAPSGGSNYDRIVGKPTPIVVEMLGIRTKFDGEMGTKEILSLVWSFRHIVLLAVLLVLWGSYASTARSAEHSAPLFFLGAVVLILGGWAQMSVISRNLMGAIGPRSASILPHILSSFVLVATDVRAALPALRTIFLGVVALIAAFALASEAGGASYVLPWYLMPTFNSGPVKPREVPSNTPPPEPAPEVKTQRLPPPPPPPPTDEKPLPPPDEGPIPPPP